MGKGCLRAGHHGRSDQVLSRGGPGWHGCSITLYNKITPPLFPKQWWIITTIPIIMIIIIITVIIIITIILILYVQADQSQLRRQESSCCCCCLDRPNGGSTPESVGPKTCRLSANVQKDWDIQPFFMFFFFSPPFKSPRWVDVSCGFVVAVGALEGEG